MPTLTWIGKKAVENHHRQVPFHLLKDVPELSVGDPGSGNLIIEGDNLLALKALLPYYAGQVKCIYIDPPYNTGNEAWIYNDNVNSNEMQEWLGKVVGGENEDFTRHDKWLCMMYPRLQLLRYFLSEDGVLFISIDDNEGHRLKFILDDIFGSNNFVSQIVWKKKTGSGTQIDKVFSEHEYVLVYTKNINVPSKWRVRNAEDGNFKNPDNDKRGAWESCAITAPSKNRNPNQLYQIEVFFDNLKIKKKDIEDDKNIIREFVYGNNTIVFRKLEKSAKNLEYYSKEEKYAKFIRRWAYIPESMFDIFQQKKVYLKNGNLPRYKKFESDYEGKALRSIYYSEHSTQEGSIVLSEILGDGIFDYPKPVSLIKTLIGAVTSKDSIILDSFAGSGTTGHTVLKLNKEDAGNRKFILIEMDSKIAREITSERIRHVAEGYKNPKGEKIEALGGGFRFATLGEPLFDEKGNIRHTVRFAELARHVYFTETGEPQPKQPKTSSPLIGICNGTAIYLLYNGILKDKSPDGGNVLTTNILQHLPKHEGSKVVYGTACRLGAERLRKEGIVFKQLPYKLKVEAR